MSTPPKAPQQPEQKYPEFKFRTKPVQERSIWESYAGTVSGLYHGITAFAGIGLLVSDKLEEIFPSPKETAPKPASSSSST
ncbi:hypothetical protein C8Q77DRAFT_1152958 [Trametes polyzona]|nr:hypothetical protein C8Q77DRAFT_1152958 [Trametes polyzona]